MLATEWARLVVESKGEVEYRRKYYGLLPLSVSLINRLIGQLIEEAADRDAIRAARRFSLYYRENIYRAAASHHRVLQLVDTFPLAALATCADWHPSQWYRDRVERASTAARLVQARRAPKGGSRGIGNSNGAPPR